MAKIPDISITGHRNGLNTLRPRQNGRHFPDDSFKCIFLNENVWISINISLKFVLGGPNNNFPALVQIMAWRWPGDKPLSELMMVSLLTHIWVTRPQWVNSVLSVLRMLMSWRAMQNKEVSSHQYMDSHYKDQIDGSVPEKFSWFIRHFPMGFIYFIKICEISSDIWA